MVDQRRKKSWTRHKEVECSDGSVVVPLYSKQRVSESYKAQRAQVGALHNRVYSLTRSSVVETNERELTRGSAAVVFSSIKLDHITHKIGTEDLVFISWST